MIAAKIPGMNPGMSIRTMRPLKAARALRELFANPDDTQQVIVLVVQRVCNLWAREYDHTQQTVMKHQGRYQPGIVQFVKPLR